MELSLDGEKVCLAFVCVEGIFSQIPSHLYICMHMYQHTLMHARHKFLYITIDPATVDMYHLLHVYSG